MAWIIPFLTIKMAPMPKAIGLLYARPRSRIPCRTRTLYPHLRGVLGSRASPVTGLLLDLIRLHFRHSCLQTVRVHRVPIFAGVGLISTRHTPKHLLFNLLLSVHVPFVMTELLVAPPAHLLIVAPVQTCLLNGRDLRCTGMSHAQMNEPR
jgi:hypothetical protein